MIKIENISEVISCLEAVSACVPSCQISISADGLQIFSKNEIARIRLKCDASAVSSLEPATFCIGELPKFISLLRTIQKYQNKNEPVEMQFNGAFLSYVGARTSFKFGTVKPDIISKFLDSEIKANIVAVADFDVTQTMLKELAQSRSIVSDSQTLRYIFSEDEVKKKMIFCAIKDTENPLSSEIRLHVGNSNASFSNRIIFNHDRILIMRSMPNVEICNVQCTQMGVVILTIKTDCGSVMTIYTAGLKS